MKTDIRIFLLGISALALFLFYSLSPYEVGEGENALFKADFKKLAGITETDSTLMAVVPDTVTVVPDKPFEPDTTSQNIFFFGDSMVDYLARRLGDYAARNGHKVNSVVWISSTTKLWAETDTLQYFLKKYDPSYVVICLASNELDIRNLESRKGYIKTIQSKLGDLPFIWISPPNWKEDTGINELIRTMVGKDRFFDSSHLDLQRGPDKKHPTVKGSAIWMDTVARWMSSKECRHPIILEEPEEKVTPKNILTLRPYNRKKKK